jgi:hypothetical protein
MSLSSWLQAAPVKEAEVRAEIWRLGAQSLGRPLESALDELAAAGVDPRRARLLRACVRKLQSR